MPETAIYELGALSVREASPKGFAVYFAHGIESMPKPLTVPPRTPSSTHPLFDGQEVSSWSNHFRTKTGARRYMLALDMPTSSRRIDPPRVKKRWRSATGSRIKRCDSTDSHSVERLDRSAQLA